MWIELFCIAAGIWFLAICVVDLWENRQINLKRSLIALGIAFLVLPLLWIAIFPLLWLVLLIVFPIIGWNRALNKQFWIDLVSQGVQNHLTGGAEKSNGNVLRSPSAADFPRKKKPIEHVFLEDPLIQDVGRFQENINLLKSNRPKPSDFQRRKKAPI